ncbi:MAG: ABC transporter ATP-binding protein, partial [Solirubrobacterales bacterium]|nr:ABC transporter ATP-binding protein [Solirubrobacterales bacterium]
MVEDSLLRVEDLGVSFATEDGVVRAVDGVSFTVHRGEVVAIVGESGSGKSVSVMTLMGLTRGPNARFEGTAWFEGRDLISAADAELHKVRGAEIAMVFQDPMSSLDPVYRVGDQIVEQIRVHEPGTTKAQALDRAVELMERVGIPHAGDRLRSYPHEFSGGMRQRVMIAIALSCDPEIILCDEPTTALDVTIQDQILRLLARLCRESGVSLVFVTHDLPVVAQICQRVAVMYGAQLVESGAVADVLLTPWHPYTRGLVRSAPDFDYVRE